MPFRLVNLANRVVLITSQSPPPNLPSGKVVNGGKNTLSQMLGEVKSGDTLVVPAGNYSESVQVSNDVHIIGQGKVTIKGIFLIGSGSLSGVEVDRLTISGERRLSKVSCKTLAAVDSVITGEDVSVSHGVELKSTHLALHSSTFSGDKEYALDVNKSICSLNNSSIEGSTRIGVESVVECRNCSLVGGLNLDIFETTDLSSTLQLFWCTVYGIAKIKSGPGTSIRSQVIGLGPASEFTDGENIDLESL